MDDPGIVKTRSTLQERLLAENPFKGPFGKSKGSASRFERWIGDCRSSIDLGSEKRRIQIWPVESRVRDERDERLDPVTYWQPSRKRVSLQTPDPVQEPIAQSTSGASPCGGSLQWWFLPEWSLIARQDRPHWIGMLSPSSSPFERTPP